MIRLEVRRVILFTTNFAAMRDFYRETLGLEIAETEEGWADFDAGPIRLAIHAGRGGGSGEAGAHKVTFFAADVEAVRAELIGRGVAMGKVSRFDETAFCDGHDPDGNRFQISNRG
ncbi:MAG TPA: VOC family protein [Sphingomonas sp.]|nr:VOC family protein [Sphingomonas sp.]